MNTSFSLDRPSLPASRPALVCPRQAVHVQHTACDQWPACKMRVLPSRRSCMSTSPSTLRLNAGSATSAPASCPLQHPPVALACSAPCSGSSRACGARAGSTWVQRATCTGWSTVGRGMVKVGQRVCRNGNCFHAPTSQPRRGHHTSTPSMHSPSLTSTRCRAP